MDVRQRSRNESNIGVFDYVVITMTQIQDNQLRLKFTLKLWKADGTVKWWHTSKIRRIKAILKADRFQNSMKKAYLKVWYGKAMANKRRLEDIYNDGEYETIEELKQALLAFTEKSLLDDTVQWIRESIV